MLLFLFRHVEPPPPSLLVFSEGTGFNGVVKESKKLTTRVAHVLPVSDDGGSTAEIVRVLGGSAVGDIRSRCLRLYDESTSEALAVRRLLGHHLPIDAPNAKKDWYFIRVDSLLLGSCYSSLPITLSTHMSDELVK
ncbi:hypothetical protein N665_1145s0016 [Sinapis alba]|nr:hypothetical protein N665_1145s0016 [Sinapis alba]